MQLALITSSEHRDDAARVDRPLIDALVQRGVEVHLPAWDDDTVNWQAYDLAVVRTTWNYQHARERFLTTLRQIEAETQLVNPSVLIAWNTHKQYLVDLEEQGVPVVPTVVVPRDSTITLAVLVATHGFTNVVIKPAVGAGGRAVVSGDAKSHTLADAFAALVDAEDVIVQPYIETVATAGEISLIVCGETVSHAVKKMPVPGDFRAHERYGARYLADDPTPSQVALARWVITTLHPHTPLVARIDMFTDANDTLYVSEVELTEPNLYLTTVPTAAPVIAQTLITAANP